MLRKTSACQTAVLKNAKNCFGELLLDGSRATDFAFEAAGEESLRQPFGPQDVRALHAYTREKSGSGPRRMLQKNFRQQTAEVNRYEFLPGHSPSCTSDGRLAAG